MTSANLRLLIAYFSRAGKNYFGGSIVNLTVGNTEVIAKSIAQMTGGELFKIEPVKKYSTEYEACTHEAKRDLSANARPELVEMPESIDPFDFIILCYPNYWGTMPMAVWTFLEEYDFSKKTILPLCTHEGSGLGRSEGDIKILCPNAAVLPGLAIQGSRVNTASSEVEKWLKKCGV